MIGQAMMTDHTPVFVFGSNEAGRHGKGAALFAVQERGAVLGQGMGRQGNSYAIPTKDAALRPLPLQAIAVYVRAFVAYALAHHDTTFELTRVGCGLAGYTPAHIAPLFAGVPDNVLLPPDFAQVLSREP